MSGDPLRWKDGGDAPPSLRMLMENARHVPPMPPELRAALIDQVPPAGPPPPAEPPAVASPLIRTALGSPVAWVGAAALVIAVAAAILWTGRPTPSAGGAPQPRAADVGAVPVVTDAAGSEPLPAIEPPPPASAFPQPAPAPSAAARPRASSPATAGPQGDSLAEESALIGRARANVTADPDATLAAVDEHARRFPHGELAPEREFLRINALRRLGRIDQARARAQTYLRTYVSSPYVPSVRKMLSETAVP